MLYRVLWEEEGGVSNETEEPGFCILAKICILERAQTPVRARLLRQGNQLGGHAEYRQEVRT